MRYLKLLAVLAVIIASFFGTTMSATAHDSIGTAGSHVDLTVPYDEEYPVLPGSPKQQKLVKDFLPIARDFWDQDLALRDAYECRGHENIRFAPVDTLLDDLGFVAFAVSNRCVIRLGIETQSRRRSQGFGTFPRGDGLLASCYTFVHEMGHLYGLDHTDRKLDIMNPDSSPHDAWLVPGCDTYANRHMTKPELARRYFTNKNRIRAGCRTVVETRGEIVACRARKRGSSSHITEKWQLRMKKELRGWSLRGAKKISRQEFDKLWYWGDPLALNIPKEYDY